MYPTHQQIRNGNMVITWKLAEMDRIDAKRKRLAAVCLTAVAAGALTSAPITALAFAGIFLIGMIRLERQASRV